MLYEHTRRTLLCPEHTAGEVDSGLMRRGGGKRRASRKKFISGSQYVQATISLRCMRTAVDRVGRARVAAPGTRMGSEEELRRYGIDALMRPRSLPLIQTLTLVTIKRSQCNATQAKPVPYHRSTAAGPGCTPSVDLPVNMAVHTTRREEYLVSADVTKAVQPTFVHVPTDSTALGDRGGR